MTSNQFWSSWRLDSHQNKCLIEVPAHKLIFLSNRWAVVFFGLVYRTMNQWRVQSQLEIYSPQCVATEEILTLFSKMRQKRIIERKLLNKYKSFVESKWMGNSNIIAVCDIFLLTCISFCISLWVVRFSQMSAVKLWFAKQAFSTNSCCSITDVNWNANMYKNMVGSTVTHRSHDRLSMSMMGFILFKMKQKNRYNICTVRFITDRSDSALLSLK